MVEQELVGVGSRLRPDQWVRITDELTWQSVWKMHIGLIETEEANRFQTIDFSNSMVIAIVDKTGQKTSGIGVDTVFIDDEIVFFDYHWIPGSQKRRKQSPENVFGFFVMPRNVQQLKIRRFKIRQGDDPEFTMVASLPAIDGGTETRGESMGEARSRQTKSRSLNITFAGDPGNGQHDGVWGMPGDAWNLVSMGTTEKGTLRYADMTVSPVRMRISNHDGAWGVRGHSGIFHSYIYHNCQCVDLEATFLDMPAGRYRALVYAHGDAPNQNASIELVVGDRRLGRKATANDGSWEFREPAFKEGVHYVKFAFDVKQGDDVTFISHRDGSAYSIFNAIQIEPGGDGL